MPGTNANITYTYRTWAAISWSCCSLIKVRWIKINNRLKTKNKLGLNGTSKEVTPSLSRMLQTKCSISIKSMISQEREKSNNHSYHTIPKRRYQQTDFWLCNNKLILPHAWSLVLFTWIFSNVYVHSSEYSTAHTHKCTLKEFSWSCKGYPTPLFYHYRSIISLLSKLCKMRPLNKK